MKILLIGHSGLLGKELMNLDHGILNTGIRIGKPFTGLPVVDIIINAAAVKDNRQIEQNPSDALQTNIIGSAQLAIQCIQHGIRYVYISTDYIYKGDRGNYRETDEILPFNLYAWTKLGGECSAKTVKNHLIIRTSFGGKFEYDQAFIDKWSSKDYVQIIAPMILEAAKSPLTGVLNLGTKRKTLYDHASESKVVMGVRISETSHLTPYDTSLNIQKWMDYHGSNPIAKPHTKCRACGSKILTKYLDLGLMPLANNLEFTSQRARSQERYPLQVLICEECNLSQLSVVIDPEKMFSYYTYRSGVNAPYVEHCYELCGSIFETYLREPVFHIDIAGNDGTLLLQALKYHKQQGTDGYQVLNIDPATNLAAISEAAGIPTIVDFWNERSLLQVMEKYGYADLITATNVFAHVDNVVEFLTCCRLALSTEGVLILEFPYLIDFINNNEYDTIYFEHLSYFSVIPLCELCQKLNLKIIDVSKQAIHGGSIRVVIVNSESEHQVGADVPRFMTAERLAFEAISRYQKWADEVKGSIRSFQESIYALKRQGFRIAAFAASAKGNTLLNAAGMNTDMIDYIVDSTPEKIGKYSPGTGIPIKHPSELKKNPPDYVILLSWNFSEAIIPQIRAMCEAKIIIPIPEFKIAE